MGARGSEGSAYRTVLYWGAPGAGKASNLEALRGRTPAAARGRLLSVAAGGSEALLLVRSWRGAGAADGSGQLLCCAFSDAAERDRAVDAVLSRADALVLVVDSTSEGAAAACASLRSLERRLRDVGRGFGEVPLVLQYNHRDAPRALSVERLNALLNPESRPWVEAVAVAGAGVPETLELALALGRDRDGSGRAKPPRAAVGALAARRDGAPRDTASADCTRLELLRPAPSGAGERLLEPATGSVAT